MSSNSNRHRLAVTLLAMFAVVLVAWNGAVRATPAAPMAASDAAPGALADIVRAPADLPPQIVALGPRFVTVKIHAREVTGRLADGATYRYWTFNGKVPGPFIRVRVNDIVTVQLTNDAGNGAIHSIDLHGAGAPDGGAYAMTVAPGETKSITFSPKTAGLYVYHDGSSPQALHIANGMYGLLLVEPSDGLNRVDREYYVMQGEIYTDKPFGSHGLLESSQTKVLAETPEYYVFNGAVGALTGKKALTANVGDRIRIFFGNAGPNKISSFHISGLMFISVNGLATKEAPATTQTEMIMVAPGGTAALEINTPYAGEYNLLDHAMARAERGLSGILIVSGNQADTLFKANDPPH